MIPRKSEEQREARPVTLELAERALRYQTNMLPPDVVAIAKQCILDWFAVTIAALNDPVHVSLFAEADEQGGTNDARIIGHAKKYPAQQAALVNGATAHALDFDDVNLAISGHPSAVIFSALLALAEKQNSSGEDVLAAFVSGYETACSVGKLICPDHLNRGFHATGTVGSFGAAAACAHLMKFDSHQTAAAMGIAGTQASGLKAMFGTMVKPLHAGLAARNGLAAALLIKRGLQSRVDILECQHGFAVTHSSDFNIEQALQDDSDSFHLRNNLFKYDASCYGTHATIECIRRLKTLHEIDPSRIANIQIRVDSTINALCNVQRPATGMQGKFSIKLNAAFALLGIDTGSIDSYSDRLVNRADVIALRDTIQVELVENWPSMQAEVVVETTSGQRVSELFDASRPNTNVIEQGQKLNKKFNGLTAHVLRTEQSNVLVDAIAHLEDLPNIATLAECCKDLR